MTEAEWLTCDDPDQLLITANNITGMRQMQLLTCALSRRAWPFTPSRYQTFVEIAERVADGEAVAEIPASGTGYPDLADRDNHAAQAAMHAWRTVYVYRLARSAVGYAPAFIADVLGAARQVREVLGSAGESGPQCQIVRDVVGPAGERESRQVGRSLLASNGTVASLAQAAYEERTLPSGELEAARLAVLADALEEAGCTDDALLSHLRSPGPHVRGCWALDLVLGKE